jgi:hypothetical protein
MDEWPYAFSGTCYPVKYNGDLFIVSAFHCYRNFQIKPENTLYPRPNNRNRFFAFDQTSRAQAKQAKDNEHYDHVVLRVAKSHHPQNEVDKVIALDLSDSLNARLPTNNRIEDFRIRGYPHDAPKHSINYDLKKISQQAYTTNGYMGIKKTLFDFCYSLKMMTPIPSGMHPNGMSGTPVYGIIDKHPVYCGTIIKYKEITGEYIVIGPEILVNHLKGLSSRTSVCTLRSFPAKVMQKRSAIEYNIGK